MKDLKAVVAQHEDDLQTHTEWKIEMSQALQDLASQMKHGFTEVAARHGDLVQAQRELAEAHKATEESLNILIRTVQDMLPRRPKQQVPISRATFAVDESPLPCRGSS